MLIIGHVATRWALDHYLAGVALEDLIGRDFGWQEGWEYRLDEVPGTAPIAGSAVPSADGWSAGPAQAVD